jgi:hypothetical protein
MILKRLLKITCFLLFVVSNRVAVAQEETGEENIANQETYVPKKGFRAGLYIGSYFANQYTANMYDGYGFDIDGNRNNWDNSLMNQKINMEYGGKGYAGQTDQIAQVLNVDPQSWTFGPTDMPTNMRYSPAIMLGLNCIYSVDVKNAIILNLNLTNLTANGNFTIITPLQANSTQINDRIKTFSIRGKEQRMMLQFGYQHLFGESEKINWFVEGGLHGTLAKFSSNEVLINTLRIDLTSYYNNAFYSSALIYRKPIGFGLGVFAGAGVNINMNPKFTIQLLYNPTYERINIGVNPRLKFQHSVGLRAYYNF